MGHISKHVVFYAVLWFLHHLLPVDSEHQPNSSHAGGARTMVSTSSLVKSVNRRGGGGGGHGGGGHAGGGHGGGGHEGGGHLGGHGNGDRSNLPIPLYGAAGAIHRNHYSNHHGSSNGISNYVCFYQFFPLFISIATGILL